MKLILTDNYLAAIRNSVGSKMFRNLYAEIDGEKKDILNNGELSCAMFVSSILYLLKLIKELHATVDGTVKDMESFDWVEINEPKEGAVVVWKKNDYGMENEAHAHIGFLIGNGKAVSNDFEAKTPIEHEIGFRGREIEKILWNTKLN